jgi:hypothetical protein
MHVFGDLFGCGCGVECSYECAALAVEFPCLAEVLALIAVRDGDCRNRVFDWRERLVERDFVSANVIARTHSTGLDGGDGSGLHSRASLLVRNFKDDGLTFDVLNVSKELSALMLNEGDERLLLRGGCAIIDDDDGACRIRIRVGIAERGFCAYDGCGGESVKRYALPGSTLDLPGHDGFVAGQIHFAIGEALAGINVGRAGLHVRSTYLGLCDRYGE